MKSNRPLSQIAARVLATEARHAPEHTPDARERTIEAIARTMRERKQRELLRRRAMGALTIAASTIVAIGLARSGRGTDSAKALGSTEAIVPAAAVASFVRGAPLVVRQGAHRVLSDGVAFEPGDRVVVDPGSKMTMALRGGTYVVVDDRANVLLVSAAPSTVFELDSGSIRADVAKRAPSERFIIRTPDAEIEVHGTSFEVSRAAADPTCGNGTTTRVKVREGIVAVRAAGLETLVHPNEVWPKDCVVRAASPAGTLAPGAPTVIAFATDPSPSNNDARTTSPLTSPPSAPVTRRNGEALPASNLAAQNDLFERAVARKRAGDVKGAIASFDELLTRYPTSHLAQGALAEQMKLLRSVDRDRARAAARAYLKAYPNGFSRSDAELILSSD